MEIILVLRYYINRRNKKRSQPRQNVYWSRASVCLSMSFATFRHYCMDPDLTWVNSMGCPPVLHFWADLQSVHGFHCCDNIAPNAKCRRVLVLALCLVLISRFVPCDAGSVLMTVESSLSLIHSGDDERAWDWDSKGYGVWKIEKSPQLSNGSMDRNEIWYR